MLNLFFRIEVRKVPNQFLHSAVDRTAVESVAIQIPPFYMPPWRGTALEQWRRCWPNPISRLKAD